MHVAVRTAALRRRPSPLRLLVVVASLLVVAAIAPRPASGAADRPAVQADAPAVELYIDRGSGAHLTQLDPDTLADFAVGPAIESCQSGYSCALSADGSTAVTTDGGWSSDESSPQSLVVVRDGLGGAERARYELPGHLSMPRLSDDGSRLVVQRADDVHGTSMSPPRWDVYGTADGVLLASVEADGMAGWRESRIDPSARRIYHFAYQPVAGATTPWPVELIAHDLTTGAEIGRLWLPEVLTGLWTTEHVVDGDPIQASLLPALALSPDGRQIALVHADRAAVTLIDAERLEVDRTVELTQPTGLANRVLGLLSLAPQSAFAKEPMEGSTAWATYAADGRFLYVWGQTSEVLDDGRLESHDTGLTLIDLETGEIGAEALDRVGIHSLHPTPDGRNLYVLGWDQQGSEQSGEDRFPLYRLDAATLEQRAIRPFTVVNLPGMILLNPVPRR